MDKRMFEVLRCVAESSDLLTQRTIAKNTGHSLGSVNTAVSELIAQGLIDHDYQITAKGMKALNPYKVENAIILAAGLSSRFVPVSYELPKGLISVKGDVMIERQIRQLQQRGIKEIVVVVGYMMDKFFYLREKYGVKLVVNNEYYLKNTHSSIYAARDYLRNTYILCSDNYYPENMFHTYEYRAFYCAVYLPGKCYTERGFVFNNDMLVVGTSKPSEDQWIMYGHAYFSREFSESYKPILEQYYGRPGVENMYWETIYAENVDKLQMWVQKCNDTEILEFDSMKELEEFDPDFISYNRIKVFGNICRVLSCDYSDISDIAPVTKGFNNRSFKFTCKGKEYIYRHPGANASGVVDRKKEARSLRAAKKAGVDETLVYIDENEGWKISKFITVTENFDFSNKKHVQMLADSLKLLHRFNQRVGFTFDYKKEAQKLIEKEKYIDPLAYRQLELLQNKIEPIFEWLSAHEWEKTLCHNDLYVDNLLISGENLSVIDWEFAGDNDIGYDICKLFAVQNIQYEEMDEWLFCYYGRNTTDEEKLHLMACATVIYYYWYIWGVLATRNNSGVADYLMEWYDKMNGYGEEVLGRI